MSNSLLDAVLNFGNEAVSSAIPSPLDIQSGLTKAAETSEDLFKIAESIINSEVEEGSVSVADKVRQSLLKIAEEATEEEESGEGEEESVEDMLAGMSEEEKEEAISEIYQAAEDELAAAGVSPADVVKGEVADEVLAARIIDTMEKIAAVYEIPQLRVVNDLLTEIKDHVAKY